MNLSDNYFTAKDPVSESLGLLRLDDGDLTLLGQTENLLLRLKEASGATDVTLEVKVSNPIAINTMLRFWTAGGYYDVRVMTLNRERPWNSSLGLFND